MNYLAVSVLTLFPLLSGSIVAMSQPLVSDPICHTSPTAGASGPAQGAGQSWGQWLSHPTRTFRQKSDIDDPRSAVAPSTRPEAEVPGAQQPSLSRDEDLDRKGEAALRRVTEMDSPQSIESFLTPQDEHQFSLPDSSP